MTNRKKTSRKKAKLEFSKLWLIGCVVLSVLYTTMSYILAWFDKNTVETLSIQVLETMWGVSGVSFVGYVLQNSVRAFTASKFGIPGGENNVKQDNNDDNKLGTEVDE